MIAYADGTAEGQTFGPVIQGDAAILEFEMRDSVSKLPVDVLFLYPEVIFELEGVEFNIVKTLSGGGITVQDQHTLHIPLYAVDTTSLHGLYTYQLRLVDGSANPRVVSAGTGTFDLQVF